MSTSPKRIIYSQAPIRICDNGGWTDTWFAKYGRIVNIAVAPYAQVQIAVFDRVEHEHQVTIHAENFGDKYAFNPGEISDWLLHPLLEASIKRMGIPEDLAIEVILYSDAPAGSATGTSAAITVALIGALDALTEDRMSPHEVAITAQVVETQDLGLQCGIQDQLCAAYGGINDIEMVTYPHAHVSRIKLPQETLWELEERLALVYLGKAHSSSHVHVKVIAELEAAGPDCNQLNDLRLTAPKSSQALKAGDFQALGQAMIENTEAQRRLHSALISADAEQIITIARENDALGWKVNGAGGDGGSVTLLCGSDRAAKRLLLREIRDENEAFQEIPIKLDHHGLRVWEST
ncbi:MAG: GHMP kinase [Anaerolineales bacterium]|nr:GHMP kinase [Chloroflexota bacterium]MBL6980442.1 GHMP kinase [Anaerolineales bacterium]